MRALGSISLALICLANYAIADNERERERVI